MTGRSRKLASTAAATGLAAAADAQLMVGVLALLLGAIFILGVGFAGAETIHNAAHDGRHAMAFPCH